MSSRSFLVSAKRLTVAGFVVFLSGGAACSRDNGETVEAPASLETPDPVGTAVQASSHEGEDVFKKLGVARPAGPTFNFADVPDPWPEDTEAACNAFDDSFPEQRACLCANCRDILHQCDALEGCIEIRECANRIGCTDANDCYLFPSTPGGCIEPIDRWGNTGFAVALSNNIGQCAVNNGCPTQLP